MMPSNAAARNVTPGCSTASANVAFSATSPLVVGAMSTWSMDWKPIMEPVPYWISNFVPSSSYVVDFSESYLKLNNVPCEQQSCYQIEWLPQYYSIWQLCCAHGIYPPSCFCKFFKKKMRKKGRNAKKKMQKTVGSVYNIDYIIKNCEILCTCCG